MKNHSKTDTFNLSPQLLSKEITNPEITEKSTKNILNLKCSWIPLQVALETSLTMKCSVSKDFHGKKTEHDPRIRTIKQKHQFLKVHSLEAKVIFLKCLLLISSSSLSVGVNGPQDRYSFFSWQASLMFRFYIIHFIHWLNRYFSALPRMCSNVTQEDDIRWDAMLTSQDVSITHLALLYSYAGCARAIIFNGSAYHDQWWIHDFPDKGPPTLIMGSYAYWHKVS